ncbi:hypothetical protein HYW41_03625 [Candidatus Daviesbacteria bacterium]|nr:hypothetical protein [Candidatus Daviesbacteria bacterium]
MNHKGFSSIIAILLFGLFFGSLAFGFYKGYLTLNTSPKIAQNQTTPNPTPTHQPMPLQSPPITTLIDNFSKSDLSSAIKELDNTINEVELLTISPINQNVIAFSASYDRDNYGVYTYKRDEKEIQKIWFLNKALGGRGGYYLDNWDMEFSPSGEAFYINKTGTFVPSFMVFKVTGEKILESQKDLGHAAWIGDNALLFITTLDVPPSILDVTTKAIISSALPKGIFHLKTNSAKDAIMAYSVPAEGSECESMTFHIYTLTGEQKLFINHVLVRSAKWLSNKTFGYQKVTGCNKEDFPTPITENKEGTF